MLQQLPVTNLNNQSFQITLSINNQNITLAIALTYNYMAGNWEMTLTNPTSNTLILDSIPLFPGIYPAANILGQYQYLEIGQWYVLNVTGTTTPLNDQNLGTDYLLVVSDNTSPSTVILATTPTTPIPDAPE
jgi:hypothetical protein